MRTNRQLSREIVALVVMLALVSVLLPRGNATTAVVKKGYWERRVWGADVAAVTMSVAAWMERGVLASAVSVRIT